jgi:hypothetical protein
MISGPCSCYKAEKKYRSISYSDFRCNVELFALGLPLLAFDAVIASYYF